jgi:hypothetical protein
VRRVFGPVNTAPRGLCVESGAMRRPRSRSARRLAAFAGALLAALLAPVAASAQVTLDPTATATKDTGGWVYWMAIGAILLGVMILILFGAMYLRYAPRFQREEEDGPRSGVRAPEASIPLQTAWQQSGPPVAVQRVPAPQPVAAVAAPAPAAVGAAAPGAAAPAAAGAPAAAPAAARPPRPKGEPAQVDQETYEKVLAEELAKGTSQRVAEGRAKSAGVKAWRAKTGAE